jgi:FkbM family methyltransferase
VRVKLRHWNKFIFNRLGFHVEPFVKSISVEALIKDLVARGMEFDNVFDVGAYKGQWTNSISRFLPADTNFFLFEPNSEHNSDLEKINHPYFNVLLGYQDNLGVDFFSVGNTGDSYYREVNPVYVEANVKSFNMMTLDTWIENNNLPNPDLLKIDTQGSELDILKGALKTTQNTKLIIAELPISQLNPGAPSICEFLDYMEKKNFTPIKITEIHQLLGVVVQIDIAFLHDLEFEKIMGHRNPYKIN